MGHITTQDSDGTQHVVWFQEKEMSCGPACVYMVECNRRLQSVMGGEGRIRQIAKMLPDGYVEGAGTDITALARALNLIGISAKYKHTSNISEELNNGNFPLIVHIAWAGGGGHFAVAEKKTKTEKVVFLDPFYGLVELDLKNAPAYTVTSGVLLSGVMARGTLSGHIVDVNWF